MPAPIRVPSTEFPPTLPLYPGSHFCITDTTPLFQTVPLAPICLLCLLFSTLAMRLHPDVHEIHAATVTRFTILANFSLLIDEI